MRSCDTTIAAYQDDEVTIITRFIGANLFETEVDGRVHDGEMAYYRSWNEAEEGHLRKVRS